MPALAWLALAVAAGVAAWFVGWPAWTAYRGRETRDDNTERYLAWRGRADRTPRATTREGMTGEERRRLTIAAVLVVASLVGLVAFFATS